MQDLHIILVVATAGLAALALVAGVALRAWDGWLELKRTQLAQSAGSAQAPSANMRIEVAALKERIRKLEAIAAGVDI